MLDLACPKCHSTRIAGVEVWGVYDGVLFWTCHECTHAWPRFTVDPEDPPFERAYDNRLYESGLAHARLWMKEGKRNS